MPQTHLRGVTPVGGPQNAEVPKEGPVIVFTGANLRCPCRPEEFQELHDLHGKETVTCLHCGETYSIPAVSYRWPPVARRGR